MAGSGTRLVGRAAISLVTTLVPEALRSNPAPRRSNPMATRRRARRRASDLNQYCIMIALSKNTNIVIALSENNNELVSNAVPCKSKHIFYQES